MSIPAVSFHSESKEVLVPGKYIAFSMICREIVWVTLSYIIRGQYATPCNCFIHLYHSPPEVMSHLTTKTAPYNQIRAWYLCQTLPHPRNILWKEEVFWLPCKYLVGSASSTPSSASHTIKSAHNEWEEILTKTGKWHIGFLAWSRNTGGFWLHWLI